jgi:predicted nucleotidyltransferase
MDLVDRIVERRDAIKTTCAKYGATAVRVFGSCARDDYDEKSDIDVLVQMKREPSGFKYFARLADLQDELKALLDVDVDVVDEAGLKGRMRERVMKEAVAL